MTKKNVPPRKGLRQRSAPWVRQTRRERMNLLSNRWGRFPDSVQRCLKVIEQRPETYSEASARKFLGDNPDFFLEMLHTYGKQSARRAFPPGWAYLLSPEEVNHAWRLADAYSKLKLREYFSKRLNSGLRDYLKTRSYPVDPHVVEKVSMRFLPGVVDNPIQSVDWRALERDYFNELKNRRRRELEDRTTTNIMVDFTVKGKRLTPNQLRNVKRWWRKNVDNYQKESDDVLLTGYLSGKTTEDIRAEVEEIKQRYIMKAQLETFPKATTARNLPRVHYSTIKKPGTREERKANYASTPRVERAQQLMQRAEAEARASRSKFDPLSYSLASLERENGNSGFLFRRLLAEKLLPEKLVIQLNVAGHLAQKAFTRVVLTTRFRETFGDKSIVSLARFLSRIKGYGVANERAHHYFESARGREMYEFLVREHILDNTHDGNKKSYLVRSHD